jgi:antitoxin component of MazEF toxin-antitoxin module
MVKQLKKAGNSSALILDKAILELVGLKEKGLVQISVHRGSIVITPVRPRVADEARFEACLGRVVRSRREALRRLAQ